MELFFYLTEIMIYFCIVIFDSSWIKYLGVIICFFYTFYMQKGYFVLFIIIIADYFLLFTDLYSIGILLFIIVQCMYHRMIDHNIFFYLPLCLMLFPSLYSLSICYALLSFFNIINAYRRKHWLFITLILLAICDIGIVIQFLFKMNISFIWWFYLPSQVYYTKIVSSNEDETIVRVNLQSKQK
ncbi:MAG: hypothetical protein HFF36_08230 [Coprobacillus sp.]|nr:hypothetical protein [Coprobacillus sp.]